MIIGKTTILDPKSVTRRQFSLWLKQNHKLILHFTLS